MNALLSSTSRLTADNPPAIDAPVACCGASVEAAQLVTPFRAALAAFKAADKLAKTLSREHRDAEEAAENFEGGETLPIPSALVIQRPPMTLTIEGKAHTTDAYEVTYRTAEQIAGNSDLTADQQAEMLAALEGWQRAQAEADEASGYAKLAREVEIAYGLWIAQYRRAERAALAVLRTPTSESADISAKRRIIKDYFDGGDEDVVKALLDAARRAPSTPASPPAVPGANADPTVAAYLEVRRATGMFAHGLDPSAGTDSANDPDEFPLSDAMLAAWPTDLAGVGVRLGRIVSEAFLHRAGDWDCPVCQKREEVSPPTSDDLCGSGEGENGGADALFRALAYLHLGIERLVAADAAASEEWDRAVAAFEAAVAKVDENSIRYNAAHNAILDQAPDELLDEPNRFGRHLRWPSLKVFDSELPHRGATPARRKLLEAWLLKQKAMEEAAGLDALAEEGDRLYEERSEAFDTLSRTRAPDLAALIQKMEIHALDEDDDKIGFADPAYVAQQRHGYLTARAFVESYADALRLAGRAAPDGMDFNPRDWIKAYEAAGGAVQERADYRGLLLGRAFECPDPVACRAREEELCATPWKARAVRLEVLEDGYKTRADVTTNRGRFSWVQFTDSSGKPLEPRIHFAMEGDAAPTVEAPSEQRGSEALQLARAL